jgi:hypothetical protein
VKILCVEPVEVEPWLLLKHYARRSCPISWSYGLYDKDVLIGILTIGKPASPNLCSGICGAESSKYVYELNRLCVNDGLPRNSLSFFVAGVIRRINNILQKNGEGMILVSYADTKYGHHGYIYQATNWIYTGATKERSDIGFEDGSHSRHSEGISPENRKHRSSKHRYVMFLGREKKKLKKLLKYTIHPYPKGDNQRYDASAKVQTQVVFL